ncbi:hypothetical protein CLAFUW4_12377 [Fulvia fulva]|nr:hypothetical protein CLAFUR4_12382 [Fulvia fulva]WPV17848.1 hypothetical protein CLAFUW4_12377 [Fulvia fulva]WPV32987.1 hypothetical protein CLAFUW7_12384 [Fulvia fulva]
MLKHSPSEEPDYGYRSPTSSEESPPAAMENSMSPDDYGWPDASLAGNGFPGTLGSPMSVDAASLLDFGAAHIQYNIPFLYGNLEHPAAQMQLQSDIQQSQPQPQRSQSYTLPSPPLDPLAHLPLPQLSSPMCRHRGRNCMVTMFRLAVETQGQVPTSGASRDEHSRIVETLLSRTGDTISTLSGVLDCPCSSEPTVTSAVCTMISKTVGWYSIILDMESAAPEGHMGQDMARARTALTGLRGNLDMLLARLPHDSK